MEGFPDIIYSPNLRLSDVPFPDASILELNEFALTFDIHECERSPYARFHRDLNNATKDRSIPELRLHLYFEQRRHSHFGRDYDEATEKKLREIVGWIREKLEQAEQAKPKG